MKVLIACEESPTGFWLMTNWWIFPLQSLNGILPGQPDSPGAAWTISTMGRAHP